MLPRLFRLKRSSLFTKTVDSGKLLWSSPYFVVLGLPRRLNSSSPVRFGFIVSKKVSNRAVIRNKMRRRLSELVRNEILPHYNDKIGKYAAIVIIARKAILEASYSDLKKIFIRYLEKDRIQLTREIKE